jgi:aspartate aminotransferase-like enzyme
VAVVHAETSSGIVNPLAGIADAARGRDALLVVDAVASLGGHALDVDALGIDLCVIGPQKALGGPAGLSVASVSPRAWAVKAAHRPTAPSSLALLDIKANWLDRGRGAVPGMPAALEFWALEAALTRVETETLAAVITRHERAARATRVGLAALGLELWIGNEAEAATLATAIVMPAGLTSATLIVKARALGVAVTPGFGAISETIVRIDHTGPRATNTSVAANLMGLGVALQRLGLKADVAWAVAEATKIWAEAPNQR